MRFGSKYQNYEIQVKEAESALVNGILFEQEKSVQARFVHGALMDWERKALLEHYEDAFRGLPDGVKPATRLSVFDTEIAQREQKWTDEFRQEAEAFMLASPDFGTDYILLEEPRLAAPWPKFDDQDIDTIESIMEATGADPDYVRRYEHENQRRAEVFALVEKLGAEHTEVSEPLIRA